MDLTDTIVPNSDQLDACDLLTGPRTFTIEASSSISVSFLTLISSRICPA